MALGFLVNLFILILKIQNKFIICIKAVPKATSDCFLTPITFINSNKTGFSITILLFRFVLCVFEFNYYDSFLKNRL